MRTNGACVLQIAGELDTATADAFAECVDAAVRAQPWPVLVDLSGLTFIDARGARVLDAVIRTLPGGRRAVVRACPRRVRRILDILGLSLDCLPAGSAPARQPGVPALVNEVRRARLHANDAKLDARRTLAELADTRIRLASTIERASLIREQGRQARARSRAAREQAARSRQQARPQPLPAAQEPRPAATWAVLAAGRRPGSAASPVSRP